MIVTIEVIPCTRFPGQEAFEAVIIDGPEWMLHNTETAGTKEQAFRWLSTRLKGLYSHRATFDIAWSGFKTAYPCAQI